MYMHAAPLPSTFEFVMTWHRPMRKKGGGVHGVIYKPLPPFFLTWPIPQIITALLDKITTHLGAS
jgi:hypothetical protein